MGNNLCSMFVTNRNPQMRVWQCPFFWKFCTSSGHFLAQPGDAQNLPKKTRPGCGSVHYKCFTKSGHFRGRPGECPKSPQTCRAAQEKNLLGTTGAHFGRVVPNRTKRCLQELLNSVMRVGSFKVVGFHEKDSTLGSGGLQFLNLSGIFSDVFW